MRECGAERRQKIEQSRNELCLCAVLLGLLTTVNEVTVCRGGLLALIKLAVISSVGKRRRCSRNRRSKLLQIHHSSSMCANTNRSYVYDDGD